MRTGIPRYRCTQYGPGGAGGHRGRANGGLPGGASPSTTAPGGATTFGIMDPYVSLYFFILTFVVQLSRGEETATWET